LRERNFCCAAKYSILPKDTALINEKRPVVPVNSYIGRVNDYNKGLTYSTTCPYRNAPVSIATMKLHTTPTQQYQTVTAYDETGVDINAQRFGYSLIVMPEMPPVPWPVTSFEALTQEHFLQIDAVIPDVVILGTGERQKFIHPKLITPLTSRRVGVETMDNQAACRTYNILMAEGRRVALALIIADKND
jgi:uncharacterized protein